VPQVDADGNEVAGVRTAELLVPMATFTGWNFRAPSTGGAEQIVFLLGSSIPLPKTAAERAAKHDPRKSVAERYASKQVYVDLVHGVADRLVRSGYLLPEDVQHTVERADAYWGAVRPIPSGGAR